MPLSDDKREQIKELVRGGKGRNETAKIVGVSTQTVSAVANREGLSFDRSATAEATEARKREAKERRSVLAHEMLGDLEEARLRLVEAATARDFQATALGLDALVRAYANLQKLEPDDGGIEAARGMVGSILGAIMASVEGVERMNPMSAVELGH